ncbi:hypothetical protein [Arthrobacter pityocampae]|uniref:hypothetical protein n=1 Tax=Arthrobacter pityocampae TaxID=547334 RepID=UPI0011B03EE1|nr:hypothetical protein [Arthrobacter pityocampae]
MNHQKNLLPGSSTHGSPGHVTVTQHIDEFLGATTTVTLDGALVSVDELESLYVYWCSRNHHDPSATEDVLAALGQQGVEPLARDGVDYVEGLVLTGGLVRDFILACEFSGVWGVPSTLEPATAREATAS